MNRVAEPGSTTPRFHRLRSIAVTGGFLDGTQIDFSDRLTCLIGARGTGKTTGLEFIRHALDAFPDDEYSPGALKKFQSLVADNLSDGAIRVSIETKDGVQYVVNRTATGAPIVTDSAGTPREVSLRAGGLFKADIYSQDQVESIADNPLSQLGLIDNFVSEDVEIIERQIRQLEAKLASNGHQVLEVRKALEGIGDELTTLPGIEDRLKALAGKPGAESKPLNQAHALRSLRDRETRLVALAEEALKDYAESLDSLVGLIDRRTSGAFAADVLAGPNAEVFGAIRKVLAECGAELDRLVQGGKDRIALAEKGLAEQKTSLNSKHKEQELVFRELIAKHTEAKGEEAERTRLETLRNELLEKKRIRNEHQARLKTLQDSRAALLGELSVLRDRRFALRKSIADRITASLAPRIRVQVEQFGNTARYREFLQEALAGTGINRNVVAQRLVDSLSPAELSAILASGDGKTLIDRAGLNANQASNVLTALSAPAMTLRLETVELLDMPKIELLDGETYKDSSALSTGQKCTTILPILLLESDRPLLIDQPEDNLDNGFIYDTIVDSILKVKGSRQMIFVTHNPNIPVLGDAEKVVVLKSNGRRAVKQKEGTVDDCKEEIVKLLEGGEEAFKKRKERYNY